MARVFETVGKELDKAVAAVDKAMSDPAVKKGEAKAKEVVDKAVDKVDEAFAKAITTARTQLANSKGPTKKVVSDVSEGLMKARDEIQRRRAGLQGHRVEDTAARVLDDVGRTVHGAVERVRSELKRE